MNSMGQCTACSVYCTSCTSVGCNTCLTGYTLNSDFTCSLTCQYPCSTCVKGSPTKCSSCLAAYSFNNQTQSCTPVTSCQGDSCTISICPSGYILSNNKCLNCTQTNCARCTITGNQTSCTVCKNGYYLNSTTTPPSCQACASKCQTCSNSSKCITCNPNGYTMQTQLADIAPVCVPCQSPCQNCYSSPSTCTSCVANYTLKGWKCMSTFNYGFNIKLNTNLTTFYNLYDQFLLAIMNAISSTAISEITMQNITSGSVVVVGNVSTNQQSNSNGAQTQFNNIQSALNNGSSIAGMQIISSNVQPIGGTLPDDNSSYNTELAIILGVCIPLGVIIIGILIYFLCIRKSSSQPPVDYQEKTAGTAGPNTSVRQTFELTREEPSM